MISTVGPLRKYSETLVTSYTYTWCKIPSASSYIPVPGNIRALVRTGVYSSTGAIDGRFDYSDSWYACQSVLLTGVASSYNSARGRRDH